jgi:hypothetical protein
MKLTENWTHAHVCMRDHKHRHSDGVPQGKKAFSMQSPYRAMICTTYSWLHNPLLQRKTLPSPRAFVFSENQYNERTAIAVGTIRASKTDIDSLVTAVSFHSRGCHGGSYEQYSLLGCNAVSLAEGQTFRKNKPHSSTGSKIKPSKTPVEAGKFKSKTCPYY